MKYLDIRVIIVKGLENEETELLVTMNIMLGQFPTIYIRK